MLAALSPDMLATDLAYYLARKGVGSVYIFECNRSVKDVPLSAREFQAGDTFLSRHLAISVVSLESYYMICATFLRR